MIYTLAMLIAHRGYHAQEKENTIAAFQAAFHAGAEAVECDVRLSTNGQIIISHNPEVAVGHLTLGALFDFILTTDKSFFLEVKNNSLALARPIIDKISTHGLWERVHIIGFRQNIGRVLSLQAKYPALRVAQILAFPLWSYVKMPHSSQAVYFGWLDAIPASRLLFKLLISPGRLKKLRERFEARGFKVMAGVINNPADLPFFVQAGIRDVFTDNVPALIEYFKKV